MALAGTLPPGPGSTAVTPTDRVVGTIVVPRRVAAGRNTFASVLNRMPPSVATTLPAGTVFEPVKS